MKQIYNWAVKQIHGKYATFVFSLCSLIEGFFFVPLTAIFVVYGIEKPRRSFYYATLAITISLIGATIGYLIGYFLWYSWGNFIHVFISPEKLKRFIAHYQAYQIWTLFIFSLFPFPFKIITISSGFFGLSILNMLTVSLIGRSIRFYAIALATFYFGERISRLINDYFYLLLAIAVGIITLFFYVISHL